jgi:uncharacterized integral membrane protein
MLRYLKLLVLLPVAVAVIGLAVANRAPVQMVFWPDFLGTEFSLTVPLFVALMLALITGVLIGGFATWLTQSSHRRAERQYRREAERLKGEADRLKAMQPAASELTLPALKSR